MQRMKASILTRSVRFSVTIASIVDVDNPSCVRTSMRGVSRWMVDLPNTLYSKFIQCYGWLWGANSVQSAKETLQDKEPHR